MENFRCIQAELELEKLYINGYETVSSIEQERLEDTISRIYNEFKCIVDLDPSLPVLHRKKHESFLLRGLNHLHEGYQCLDSSRPWLCYWILHGLELLGSHVSSEIASKISNFLKHCQSPNGGFCGGPSQYPHLATTYAAVNALMILGTEEAYKIIDRKKLHSFLLKMKTKSGAFRMHEGGEEDLRGAYCALSAASMLNILSPELVDGVGEWIVSCQTYEGGFGGVPDLEAHGGYSFCGLAALVILGRERLCDLDSLLKWAVNRQMKYEGGFQGRTNKLVDGCYSFWQGGIFPLIHRILSRDESSPVSMEKWLFHQGALQEYLLICCQNENGGLIDKPGKGRDFYHTCYGLSGLSVAQHFASGLIGAKSVIGNPENELAQTHPVYNIGIDAVTQAYAFFKNFPISSSLD